MRHAAVIAGREVRSLFTTPVAYVTLATYLLILGYFFFVGLGVMLQQIQQIEAMQMFDLLQQFNLNERVIAPAYGTASIILVFVVPLITMGVFADERRQGTIELLLTSPLTIWEIVLGKFFGVLAFVTLLVAGSAVFPLFLFFYGDPEFWQVAANLIGLFCTGAAIAAFGCFASSLTRSPVVAAVIGILGSLFLWLIGLAGQIAPEGTLRSVVHYLGTLSHFDPTLEGLVQTEDLAYFAIVVVFFLTLVRAIVESLRLR